MKKPDRKSSAPVRRVNLRLDVDEATHRLLRLAAAHQNQPMAEFARRAVREAAERVIAAAAQ